MLFRQPFDPETSTWSYLLADETTCEAILIDSVREQVERDVVRFDRQALEVRATPGHTDGVTYVCNEEPLALTRNALLIRDQGFQRVASLHGGMVRWAELGLPAIGVRGGGGSQEADAFLGADI